MAITYDAPNDTIVVTGYTEALPCTFTDIYNADQAGGWGRVSKLGTHLFQIDCKLQIGNGSTQTWFATEREAVVFTKDVIYTLYLKGGYYAPIRTHFRMGDLEVNGEPFNGSILIFETSVFVEHFYCVNSDVKFYDSTITLTSHGEVYLYASATNLGSLDIRRSRADFTSTASLNYFAIKTTDTQIDGLEIYGASFLPEITPLYTWNDVYIMGQTYGTGVALLPEFGQPITIQNLKVSDKKTHMFSTYGNAQVEVINADMDWNKITFEAPTGDEWWKFFNSFDLTVEDKDGNPISGATVTLWNKDDAQVFQTTTDVNGKTATQNVLCAYLDASTGSTPTFYSPYRLKIEKTGYQTYDHDGIALDEKTTLEIKLSKAVGVFLDFGRPVINLKKSDPENKNVMVC